jgi:TRAP-type mannitol/chloroaromatic compound transport system permease small subunit
MSYTLYGAMFFMAGAYTLSRGGHVRADMFSRLWRPRTQAVVELVLYILFFFPGILALVVSGWAYGTESMRIREVSVNSPAGVPIWPIKMLIPLGAGLLALQGVAEVLRCLQCLRDGRWAPRLHDVEELEKQILEEHAKKAAEGDAK